MCIIKATKGYKQKHLNKKGLTMLSLSKMKFFKRSLAGFVSIVALATAAFFAIKSVELFRVEAITDDGESVSVDYGDDIYYGYSEFYEEGYRTNLFEVTNSSDEKFTAFCAEPGKINPEREQSFEAIDITNTDDADVVKLIAYIATAGTDATKQLMATYYDPLLALDSPTNPSSPEDRRYAYAHATIGRIYGDSHGLTDEMANEIDEVIDDLNRKIENSDEIWLMASNYHLFRTNVESYPDIQAVVWIEYNENFSISTVATDAKDGDKFVEASSTASITDTISYCATPNLTYTIQGILMDKATGKPITVDGSPVQKEITETPTTSTGCYTTTMAFNLDTSELYGKDIVVFETLSYEGEPVAEHKELNDASQTVTVINLGTTAVDGADGDKLIEASADSKIVDSIDYCLRADLEYTIKGVLMDKETKKPLTVNGETIEETLPLDLTNDDDNCGTVQMTFTLDSTELAGKAIVVYESVEYNDETILTHQDINDTDQTVNIISLDTYALDKTDSDKELLADKNATVADHIKYCLVAGTNYTIVGTLMNKKTGEPITINDVPIWSTANLTPEENCGDLYLDFEFDATGLAGTEIVVFEAAGVTSSTPLSDSDICLEHDAENPDTCKSYFHTFITHAELNDAAQTIIVADPPETPETGLIAKSVSGDIDTSSTNDTSSVTMPVALTVASFAIYFAYRLVARKKFRLSRH